MAQKVTAIGTNTRTRHIFCMHNKSAHAQIDVGIYDEGCLLTTWAFMTRERQQLLLSLLFLLPFVQDFFAGEYAAAAAETKALQVRFGTYLDLQ